MRLYHIQVYNVRARFVKRRACLVIKDGLPPPGTKKRPRHAGFPLRGLLRETLVLIGLSGVFRLISTGLIVSDPFGDQYYHAGHYTYLDKYRNKSGYVVQSFKTVDSNECGDIESRIGIKECSFCFAII